MRWAAAAALFCLNALASQAPREIGGEFSAQLPAEWQERSSWHGRYPAFVLFLPGAGADISVEKFTVPNALYPDAAAYSARFGGSPLRGKKKALGKSRSSWERRSTDAAGAFHEKRGPAVPVRERLLLLEERDRFYAVRFKAPESRFEKLLPVFDAFVESLKKR